MKVSDYIVDYIIQQKIEHVFGYPGGMVTDLMDSLSKRSNEITAYVVRHEQAAAFAACGYAQATHKTGVAYATSGPGATNLITGIANAYFDSIPCVFITGQVNTYESKGELPIRQSGFQEMNIVAMVQCVTKYAVQINEKKSVVKELEKAFRIAQEGRPGPVLIDIPMNVFKSDIPLNKESSKLNEQNNLDSASFNVIIEKLNNCRKPVILAGRGIEIANVREEFRKLVETLKIPIVTSMIAIDSLEQSSKYNYGFIGAYGNRFSNIILNNSDLIISMGSRLDRRQIGNNLELFAPKAQIIRIDIDHDEFSRKVKNEEIEICASLTSVFNFLLEKKNEIKPTFKKWIGYCDYVKYKLQARDRQLSNVMVNEISKYVPNGVTITTDVGQNQVWVAQSFALKDKQRIFFSGGHGAMGYSLPAAMGLCAATQEKVISFNGDGGIQMNIQELNTVKENNLPIKIFVFNNHSLGMIRHFQEMYFNSDFVQTTSNTGYNTPDFQKISLAYDIPYVSIHNVKEIPLIEKYILSDGACIIEIFVGDTTYVYPKLAMGRPISDQEPLLERKEYKEIMEECSGI